MNTVSIGIANYCVPCHAHCRYCLLSSCGKATGVDYERSKRFADRIISQIKEQKPGISAFFYVGYCMDMPDLADYIRFCKKHDSPGAKFLQMNGFAFRSGEELAELMKMISDAGVELIDLTFFGTVQYHDRFAGRGGDFGFNLSMLDAANKAKIPVNISVPLIRGNLPQMEELRKVLSEHEPAKVIYYLPHSKGRGRSLKEERITREEFEGLSPEIKKSFSKTRHLTESEWIGSDELKPLIKRTLTLVLTPDNIDRMEKMDASGIINYLEQLDDAYLEKMPSPKELAKRYGDPDNKQLFRERDLLLKWEQMYIDEMKGSVYDMHDETHSFGIHS